MSARSKKIRNTNSAELKTKLNMELREIEPLTDNQSLAFQYRRDHLLMYGCAGTGKTFLALYQAFDDVLEQNLYYKVVIIRSIVSTRNMGFLPGNEADKANVYQKPYISICSELFGRGDAYDYLKQKKIIEFETTSFLRGVTLNNCVVVLDEFQNMTAHELDTVMTRLGNNCRIIVSGDHRQDDLPQHREKSGARDIITICKAMNSFRTIEFGFNDIVRGKLVKEYIIARHKLESEGDIKAL